ncbi:hypothetical protein R3P38DRAFT_3228482 [Favolaschia claudopus]|uniref:Uncharacterized protein n=1 Tax=Favolaschia claudopus TaxID=2862362 RepID=A0AAV9ZQ05_9AGAR
MHPPTLNLVAYGSAAQRRVGLALNELAPELQHFWCAGSAGELPSTFTSSPAHRRRTAERRYMALTI